MQGETEIAKLLFELGTEFAVEAGQDMGFQRRGISLERRVRAINKAKNGMAIA